MNLRKKKIILVDKVSKDRPVWVDDFPNDGEEFCLMDPLELFTQLDWTQFEDDAQTINQIYSHVFEEVVIHRKTVICFWPLSEQMGNEWFELKTLLSKNNFDLEVYKQPLFESSGYELDYEILRSWKRLVYFLIDSLLEDIQLNDQFEELATLTNGNETIFLFRMENNGVIQYSFASNLEYFDLIPHPDLKPSATEDKLSFFDSFDEMLASLFHRIDASGYRITFNDRNLEKSYYHVFANELKTENIIQHWLTTYSLN